MLPHIHAGMAESEGGGEDRDPFKEVFELEKAAKELEMAHNYTAAAATDLLQLPLGFEEERREEHEPEVLREQEHEDDSNPFLPHYTLSSHNPVRILLLSCPR